MTKQRSRSHRLIFLLISLLMALLLHGCGSQGVEGLQGLSDSSPVPTPEKNTFDLKSESKNRSISLTWNSVDRASAYRIYQDNSNTPIASVAENKYTIKNLTNGKTYSYRIKINFRGKLSGYSSATSATPMPPLPSIPTKLSAKVGYRSVIMTWMPSTEATTYSLSFTYKNGASGVGILSNINKTSATVTTFDTGSSIDSLETDVAYDITVTAHNLSGKSVPSAKVKAIPNRAIPTSLTAISGGDGKIVLNWVKPSNQVLVYTIYYSNSNTMLPKDTKTVQAKTPPTTITSLVNRKLYYLQVLAEYPAGEMSARSNTAAAIPVLIRKLNDTGLTKQTYTVDNSNENTPRNLLQDYKTGRDAEFAKGAFTKSGSGVAGFDFTKLSDANNSGCVKDNHTGLVWEVKTIANKDAVHTIPANSKTSDSIKTHIITTNGNTGLCGHTDWRLPTLKELASIIYWIRGGDAISDNSISDNTAHIDTQFFPNTSSAFYCSSTPKIVDANSISQLWGVDFGLSKISSNSTCRIRLVSGKAF